MDLSLAFKVYFSLKHSILMAYMLREKKRDTDNIIKLTANIELAIHICFYSYLKIADKIAPSFFNQWRYKVDVLTGGSSVSELGVV